jgi:hypothetical protein
MLRRALVISGLLAGVACDGGAHSADVVIEATPVAPERARGESFAALESGHHEIRVRRTMAVPDACRTLSGDLVRTGNLLTLRVIAHPGAGEPCERAESYLAYTATILGLRPGRYDLRVVHANASDRRAPEVVLEHPIVVLERSVQVE